MHSKDVWLIAAVLGCLQPNASFAQQLHHPSTSIVPVRQDGCIGRNCGPDTGPPGR